MRHSWERGSSQRNHHIERRRRRTTLSRKATNLRKGPLTNIPSAEIEDKNLQVPNAALYPYKTMHNIMGQQYGACSLGIHWEGRVLGPQPQKGPSSLCLGQPGGGQQGKKVLPKNQQLMYETSKSYSGMQRVCTIKRQHLHKDSTSKTMRQHSYRRRT